MISAQKSKSADYACVSVPAQAGIPEKLGKPGGRVVRVQNMGNLLARTRCSAPAGLAMEAEEERKIFSGAP
jgi:hypothetical protein